MTDTVTVSRELLRQAIEAFELHAKQYPHMVKGYTLGAATALRAALEQPAPVQEPAAEILPDVIHRNAKKLVFTHHGLSLPVGTKLYTATQPAPVQEQQPATVIALCDEIERLTACLKKANDQAEHFEREWYLRGDEIERLRKDAGGDRYTGNQGAARFMKLLANVDPAHELPEKPAPVQEPDAIGCTCSVCGEWQRWTLSGMICKNGHGGADGINHKLYTAPQPMQELRALEESRSKAWAVAKSLQTQVNILLPVVESAADDDDEYGIGPKARKALDALAAHKET